jgi:hypothetical protein
VILLKIGKFMPEATLLEAERIIILEDVKKM